MEFLQNPWVLAWLGTGLICAIGAAIMDSDTFMMGDEFKKEFSVGLFMVFVAIGPFFILVLLFQLPKYLADDMKAAKRAKKHEAEQRQINEKAKATREKNRAAFEAQLPEKLQNLNDSERVANDPEAELRKPFFEQVVESADFFLKARKADLATADRIKLISVVKTARIKVMTSLRDDDDAETLALQLSTALEKVQKKYGEKKKVEK